MEAFQSKERDPNKLHHYKGRVKKRPPKIWGINHRGYPAGEKGKSKTRQRFWKRAVVLAFERETTGGKTEKKKGLHQGQSHNGEKQRA